MLNHIIPVVKGTTVEFDPVEASFYEFHLWLDVNKIFAIPNAVQSLAIGDTLIGTSVVNRYSDKKHHAKYGLGATKLTGCGIFKINSSEYLQTNSRRISFDSEILNDYQRKCPVITLTRCLNYDIRIKRYQNLFAFNQSRDSVIRSACHQQNRKHYFDVVDNDKTKKERFDQLYKSAKEVFKDDFAQQKINPNSPLMLKQTSWFNKMRLHNKNTSDVGN